MSVYTGTRPQQVKADVLEYIAQRRLQRNDPLPSESSIAKLLGVSRNTVREAYILLEKEGTIVRRHGIGTFVANSNVIRDPLDEFLPFAQIIRKSGYSPGFKTLSMAFEPVPAHVSEVFNLAPQTPLRRIKRLVQADQEPVIYVDDYISPMVEEAGLDWDTFDGNMVDFLATSRKLTLNQIQSRIRVAPLTRETSQYLALRAGTRILTVWSTIFTTDNRPAVCSEVCFKPDFVELSIVRSIRS